MRITSKGQVTIPLDVRQKLGLLPGTEVEFEVAGDAAKLRKSRGGKSRGKRLVERLKGTAPRPGLTTDQLMALLRGED